MAERQSHVWSRPEWQSDPHGLCTSLNLTFTTKKQVDNFLGIDFHKMHRTYYKELVK
jgi:hypothetical protein